MFSEFANFTYSKNLPNMDSFNRATRKALDLIEERKGELVLPEAKSGHGGLIRTLIEQSKVRPTGVIKFIERN
jgi:hypothetical protein